MEPMKSRPDMMLERRRNMVVEMRLAGLTYEQIAAKLDVSPSVVRNDLERSMEQQLMARSRNIDVLVEEQLTVLLVMRRSAWNNAIKGDTRSIETVLKVTDRIIKLLRLSPDMNVNLEVTSVDAIERQIQELTKAIALEEGSYEWSADSRGIQGVEVSGTESAES